MVESKNIRLKGFFPISMNYIRSKINTSKESFGYCNINRLIDLLMYLTKRKKISESCLRVPKESIWVLSITQQCFMHQSYLILRRWRNWIGKRGIFVVRSLMKPSLELTTSARNINYFRKKAKNILGILQEPFILFSLTDGQNFIQV